MQGRLGLELAREHKPDLILLDLHLPDLPGDEVVKKLQADPKTSGIPLVVISADATPGQVSRLLRTGVAAYLTKPLNVERLLKVFDDHLVEGQATDAVHPQKTPTRQDNNRNQPEVRKLMQSFRDVDLTSSRILIVDDQEANVRLIEFILDSAGFKHYTHTTDSRKVLELCSTFLPDILLLDLQMPHLDGYAVMTQLAANFPPRNICPFSY